MRSGAIAAAVIGALLVACATLPVPTPSDAERARVSGRETTVDALAAGRSAYLARCGTCHQYYQPSEHTPGEWPKLVDDMRERSKLDDEMQARIVDYLVVLSDAPPPKP